MRRVTCFLLMAVLAAFTAQAASAQAIQSWTGGSEFTSYYGSAAGDVVGYRFMVNTDVAVESLGAWNADTGGGGGLDSDHEVGIWDDTMTLIASATVTPTSTVDGDFRYEAITPVILATGTLYTIGAIYTPTDDDNYISSATGLVTDPDVTWVNAVFPAAAELGFVFPTEDSAPTSQGRFGPNFTFGPPTIGGPPIVEIPTLGAFGLVALLLGLGGAAVAVIRRRKA